LVDIAVDELPGDLPLIADMVGVERAMAYAAKFGGVTLYLVRWDESPDKWNIDIQEMVDYFGKEQAKRIVKQLAPGQVTIPNCKQMIARQIHDKIIEERNAGAKVRFLARKYRLHERMIRRVLSVHRNQQNIRQGVLL